VTQRRSGLSGAVIQQELIRVRTRPNARLEARAKRPRMIQRTNSSRFPALDARDADLAGPIAPVRAPRKRDPETPVPFRDNPVSDGNSCQTKSGRRKLRYPSLARAVPFVADKSNGARSYRQRHPQPYVSIVDGSPRRPKRAPPTSFARPAHPAVHLRGMKSLAPRKKFAARNHDEKTKQR